MNKPPSLIALSLGLLSTASLSLGWAATQASGAGEAQPTMQNSHNRIIIRFPEPVVSLETVTRSQERRWRDNSKATETDCGADRYILNGDAEHRPEVVWEDQDRLVITPADDSVAGVPYTLKLKPGLTYLSGREVSGQREFTFSFKGPQLQSLGSVHLPGLAVPLGASRSNVRAQKPLSPDCGITYTFHEVKKNVLLKREGYRRTGKTVGGHAEPLRLNHGVISAALENLSQAKADFRTLTPDAVIPDCVLIVPDAPLPEGSFWELTYKAADGYEPNGDNYLVRTESTYRFGTGLMLQRDLTDEEEGEEPEKQPKEGTAMLLYTEQPVAKEELPRLFREMPLRVGAADVAAAAPCPAAAGEATEENGKLIRRAEWNGKPVEFIFEGVKETEQEGYAHPLYTDNTEDRNEHFSYRDRGAAYGILMRVRCQEPLTVETEIPENALQSRLGLSSGPTHRHRRTLTPEWPSFDLTKQENSYGTVMLMPRSGDRSLAVRVYSGSTLEASACYWEPAAVCRRLSDFRQFSRNMSDSRLAELETMAAWLNKRRENGFNVADQLKSTNSQIKNEKQRLNKMRDTQKMLCALGSTTAPKQYELPEAGMYGTTEQAVKLDELMGGEAKPGLYLVTLRVQPSAAAAAALQAVGKTPETTERHLLIQLSGLNTQSSAEVLMVRHLADGQPVEEAECRYEDGRDSLAIRKGLAFLAEGYRGGYIVTAGDDWSLCDAVYRSARGEQKPETRMELLTDRNLYRPGETVHLFGMIRSVHAKGSTLKQSESLCLTIRNPKYEIVVTKDITPDAFGTFEASYTLPNGEEDVTGSYTLQVEDKLSHTSARTTARSEVFRRDSFRLEAAIDAAEVDPKEFKWTLTATDYNGTPLADAKVELNVTSPRPILLQEATDDGDYSLHKTLRTGGDGSVTFSAKLGKAPEPKQQNGPRLYIPYRSQELTVTATVSNDREEVRKNVTRRMVYDTDMALSLSKLRVKLHQAGHGDNPLDREQSIHVLATTQEEQEEVLPNGFSFFRTGTKTVWEGDMHFPAHDKDGLLLPFELPKKIEHGITLTFTAKDGGGRDFRQTQQLYAWELRRTEDEEENTLNVRSQEVGTVEIESSAETTAWVIVSHAAGRQFFNLPLQVGTHSYTLPQELLGVGSHQVQVASVYRAPNGLYTRFRQDSTSFMKEDRARRLDVTLTLPQPSVRPGSTHRLTGTVKDADGKAAEASVLLFAVDEGMLSVSGGKQLPNWEYIFSLRPNSVSMPHESYWSSYGRSNRTTHRANYIKGLWIGDTAYGDFWKETTDFFPMLYRNGMEEMDCAAVMEDCCEEAMPAKAAGGIGMRAEKLSAKKGMLAAAPCMAECDEDEGDEAPTSAEAAGEAPRLRSNFTPVAVWQAALKTDADGCFSADITLPDTLTTYTVFCAAADKSGNRFGNHTASLMVNQPVMLTPGTPLFMSTGDRLMLPLTITNATDSADTWEVELTDGSEKRRESISLAAKATGTLYFEIAPQEEGEHSLQWTARAAAGADAVEGRFPVRYPAPLLKETHHLVLSPEATAEGVCKELSPAELLAPELKDSVRGELVAELSANPLLHLAGCADFVLSYPYGCTEQTSTGLLPWLMYDRLSPFCPRMAETAPEKVHEVVTEAITRLLKRQQKDGGLSYWDGGQSCFWASAHAALILKMAQEKNYSVPQEKLDALCAYLLKEQKRLKEEKDVNLSPLTAYEIARAVGDKAAEREALERALKQETERTDEYGLLPRPFYCCLSYSMRTDLELLLALQGKAAGHHAAFLTWMRSRGHDYRHPSTWSGAWTLIALYEYLRQLPAADAHGSVMLADGRTLEPGNGITRLTLAGRGTKLGDVQELIRAVKGTTYLIIKAKAQPQQTEYPGVTEKGLQITRLYEKKGADGIWRPATEFNTGDVVRVTLTCAKVAPELRYLVLEDYLPSCMEAVNPAIRSQAAGIEFVPWSAAFDNKEYLADRVRGFCTRWHGRSVLNMVYFARVKRAGVSTAPPAQGQLMYEPQIHGLSPNTRILSR